jgi:uncharacterized protein
VVIDFHTHVFPDNIAAGVVETLRSKTRERVDPAGDGTAAQLMTQMRAAAIDRAVLCPIATKPEQFDAILRFARAIRSGLMGEQAQRMLIPFASVHPSAPERCRQLESIAACGIRGIKLHPYYQKFALDSEPVIDLLRCCRDLHLTVLCHCGRDIGFPDADCCTPAQIAALHEKVQGIQFVAAHLGGWRMWDEALRHLAGSQVYLDTSVLEADLHTEAVQELLHRHPAQRLLLASDWPWCPLNKAAALVRALNRSEPDKALILGGNAERLLLR